MRLVKVALCVLAAFLAIGVAGASASNACKPVNGVSRCVFGIETTPGAEPEPIQAGQPVQSEWWGRGSYFNAGRYSFLCRNVVFDGSVAGFMAGTPLFSASSADFQGVGAGGECNTITGTAHVSADTTNWQFRLGVTEQGAGQFLITDTLKTTTKAPLRFTAEYFEEGFAPIVCTFQAKSVKGTSTWAAHEQIGGRTAAAGFKLDTEADNSPQCSSSGKLETSWRFAASPPAGGFLPLVLAIH
jgi:hypothetical protein